MITTFYFIQLIAFQLLYVTSEQVEHTDPPSYLLSILRHRQTYRMIGGALMLLVTIAFVVQWGWMTGICASLVGLMGVGCLVVSLNPFRYVNETGVVVLYVFFLTLEFLV
ncbi:hypothetical protein [Parachryseolinea silvisoli]|uniref:hypothetical protein n=1 Tax=Parachryseolinea silvisoli TaxID=2873601 RepID=UPI0022659004|nr:hypothetical protein [Parachryseolinea silvisoli]MCD9016657.1 hypothetical protein [Parachryseolinea silvisoli]